MRSATLALVSTILLAPVASAQFDATFGSDGKSTLQIGSESITVTAAIPIFDPPDRLFSYRITGYTDTDQGFLAEIRRDGVLNSAELWNGSGLAFGRNSEGHLTDAFADHCESVRFNSLALDRAYRTIVVGTCKVGPWQRRFIARYTYRGRALDTSFSDDGVLVLAREGSYHDGWNDVVIDSQDRIIAVGSYTGDGAGGSANITWISSDGVVLSDRWVQSCDAGQFASTVAVQPDDRAVVAGRCILSGGIHPVVIYRFEYDETEGGRLDTAFGDAGQFADGGFTDGSDVEAIYDLGVDTSGRIVAVGSSAPDGIQSVMVYRLTPAGELDAGFAGSGRFTKHVAQHASAASVAVHPSGGFIMAGRALDSGTTNGLLLSYDSSGDPNSFFGDGGHAIVDWPGELAAAVIDGPHVVAVGTESVSGGRIAASRLNAGFPAELLAPIAEAVLEPGPVKFGWDGSAETYTLQLSLTGDFSAPLFEADVSDPEFIHPDLPSGAYYWRVGLGGDNYSPPRALQLSWLAPDDIYGVLDPSFGFSGGVRRTGRETSVSPDVAAAQTDGSVVFAGSAVFERQQTGMLMRVSPTGTFDVSFGEEGYSIAERPPPCEVMRFFGLAVDAQDRLVVGGDCQVGGEPQRLLARFTSDGQLDPSFGGNPSQGFSILFGGSDYDPQWWNDVQIDDSGRIWTVGQGYGSTVFGGQTRGMMLGVFSPDGTLIDMSGSGLCREGTSIALQEDGKAVVSGSCRDEWVLWRHQLNDQGVLTTDSGFGTNGVVRDPSYGGTEDGEIRDIMIQANGLIVTTGVSGLRSLDERRAQVRRHLPDGTPDQTFNSNALSAVKWGRGTEALGAVQVHNGDIMVVGQASFAPKSNSEAVAFLYDGVTGELVDTYGQAGGIRLGWGTAETTPISVLDRERDLVIAARSTDEARNTGSAAALALRMPDRSPTLTSPANDQTLASGSISFSWSSPDGPWVFQVSREANFESTVLEEEADVASFEIADLEPGPYYWRVGFPYNHWSAARSFVVEAPVLLWGDADGDESVTVGDAGSILRFIVGAETLGNPEAADASGDSEITVADAVLVLQVIVGLKACFPADPLCSS